MSDNRPSVYTDGKQTVYRASSLGNCLSALTYARLGHEPAPTPEWLLGKFQEGTDWENTTIAAVCDTADVQFFEPDEEDYPFEVDDTGQAELELKWGKGFTVRCHPDGVVYDGSKLSALEVKTVGDALYDKLEKVRKDPPVFASLLPGYAWQASVEMLASGYDLLYGYAKKQIDDEGRVVGVTDPRYFWLLHPGDTPFTLDDIKARVREVEQRAKAGDAGLCDYAMFPCGYYDLHRDDDPLWAKHVHELTEEQDDRLGAIIERYVEGRDMENEGKRIKSEASTDYRVFVQENVPADERQDLRFATHGYEVVHVEAKSRRTDWQKVVEAANIDDDLVGQYVTETSYLYPKVKKMEDQ